MPYRSCGPALTDLLAGQVQVMFPATVSSIEYIGRAGCGRSQSPPRRAQNCCPTLAGQNHMTWLTSLSLPDCQRIAVSIEVRAPYKPLELIVLRDADGNPVDYYCTSTADNSLSRSGATRKRD